MDACDTCAWSDCNNAGLGADGRLLGGKLLGGNGVLRRQRLVAAEVHPGIGEGGAIAGQLALGLGQGGLIGARIDLGQQIALFHLGADVEGPFLHIAADLGIDGRAGESLNVARQGKIAAALGGLELDHLHGRHGLIFGPGRGVVALPQPPADAQRPR